MVPLGGLEVWEGHRAGGLHMSLHTRPPWHARLKTYISSLCPEVLSNSPSILKDQREQLCFESNDII